LALSSSTSPVSRDVSSTCTIRSPTFLRNESPTSTEIWPITTPSIIVSNRSLFFLSFLLSRSAFSLQSISLMPSSKLPAGVKTVMILFNIGAAGGSIDDDRDLPLFLLFFSIFSEARLLTRSSQFIFSGFDRKARSFRLASSSMSLGFVPQGSVADDCDEAALLSRWDCIYASSSSSLPSSMLLQYRPPCPPSSSNNRCHARIGVCSRSQLRFCLSEYISSCRSCRRRRLSASQLPAFCVDVDELDLTSHASRRSRKLALLRPSSLAYCRVVIA